MNRNFKGIWIPKEVWLNKNLTIMEKLFLVEIDSLDNEKGCFASNKHFAEMFQLSKNRCSEIINSLKEKKYIKISYQKEGNKVQLRTLKLLIKIPLLPIRKTEGGYSENRDTPIRKTEGGYSENTEDIYTSLTKQKESESALDFLKTNFPSQYETFLMQNKKMITDFPKFEMDFNDTVEMEELEYKQNILFPRLRKYARNWIQNQNKYNNTDEKEPIPIWRRKIS